MVTYIGMCSAGCRRGKIFGENAFAFAEKWGYMNYMKKVLAAIIAFVMVFSVSVAGFASEVNIEDSKVDPVNLKGAYCGDADGNKSVDITDAMLVFIMWRKKRSYRATDCLMLRSRAIRPLIFRTRWRYFIMLPKGPIRLL